jgi:DNA-binding CsgD family transcriptional regulator
MSMSYSTTMRCVTGPWPFAGRSAQLATVRDAVTRRGVVLAGPAGVGKSRLAAEVAAGVSGCVRVTATTAASEIPLGALAHALPPDQPVGNVIRWAADALRDRVLVVDDAHLLDPVSATLVHHLAASGAARVLATIRGGARAPDAVSALWKDDLLPRLELEPLGEEEAIQLLGAALGGTVEATTGLRLARISGGNVLFLRELVLAGQASGALMQRNSGVWVWQGELSVTTRLKELIESRIGHIAPDERSALEYIAHGEPLDIDVLEALAEPSTVRRLESRALAVVGEDYAVRLAHPLYGEVIRAGCGRLRTRDVLGELADAVTARGVHGREDQMRVAVWQLGSGRARDPRLLFEAAATARLVRDLKLAARLARAAIAAGAGIEATLLLIGVLNHDELYDEAQEVLASVDTTDLTEESKSTLTTSQAVTSYCRNGDPDLARAQIHAGLEELTEVDSRGGLLSFLAATEYMEGEFGRAREVNQQIELEGSVRPYITISMKVSEAGILAHEGRSTACEQLVTRALLEIEQQSEGLPTLRSTIRECGAIAALYAGDLDKAQAYAEAGYDTGQNFGGWNRAIMPHGARRAQVHRLRGEFDAAIRLCRQLIVRLPDEPNFYAGPCLGELAHALALTGDITGAQAALRTADRRTLRIGIFTEPPLRAAQTWLLAAQGDVAGAVKSALRAAELSQGYYPYELAALHDVVRLGRADLVAARITQIADATDGSLAPLMARHAKAAAGPAPAALEAVSNDFERLGYLLHAAEAAAQAALGYRDQGLQRPFQAAQLRAFTLARRCGTPPTPALTGLTVPDLTPRQREIAQLAATGLTNRQIAERLVISVRTVANTLGATYDKLGVNDRAGLSRILRQI